MWLLVHLWLYAFLLCFMLLNSIWSSRDAFKTLFHNDFTLCGFPQRDVWVCFQNQRLFFVQALPLPLELTARWHHTPHSSTSRCSSALLYMAGWEIIVRVRLFLCVNGLVVASVLAHPRGVWSALKSHTREGEQVLVWSSAPHYSELCDKWQHFAIVCVCFKCATSLNRFSL